MKKLTIALISFFALYIVALVFIFSTPSTKEQIVVINDKVDSLQVRVSDAEKLGAQPPQVVTVGLSPEERTAIIDEAVEKSKITQTTSEDIKMNTIANCWGIMPKEGQKDSFNLLCQKTK
jgi:hypothetical protein